jgi:hypothetical protein
MADEDFDEFDYEHYYWVSLGIVRKGQDIRMESTDRVCVNDWGGLKQHSRRRPAELCHDIPTTKEEAEAVLQELAFVIENTKDSAAMHTSFPMWMCSLVVSDEVKQKDIKLHYCYVPEREIRLCKNCVQELWKTMAQFKENNPDIVRERLELPQKEPVDWYNDEDYGEEEEMVIYSD